MSSPPDRPGILKERALISHIRDLATGVSGKQRAIRVGIGDDCAVIRIPRGHELCVTTDLLLETTHFRRDWHSPEAVGYRCLARGLSDLAAMGAKPVAAFLSFAIPAELNGAWVQCFLDGLLKHAERAGVPLVGGDTAQAPGLASQALFSADITLIGSVPSGTALLRSRARPGDLLYVTGQLGGSAAELAAISTHPGHFHRFTPPDKLEKLAEHPHLFPALRLIQGARLRKLASAALDLSDGLSTDLGHLCEASRVRAILEAGAIPIHPLADGDLSLALHGGEDYELLFSARPGTAIPQSIGGVPVTRIGRLIARSDSQPVITLTRTQPNGTLTRESLAPSGWQHFETVSARSARPAARSKNIDKPKA